MKNIWLVLFIVSLSGAKVITSVIAVVNGEPITSYEIELASKEEKVSKAEALEVLIDLRLQEAHIKELGLSVDDYELEDRLKMIASRNNLEFSDLEEVIKSRGMDWDRYKEDTRKAMLNERLASRVLRDEIFPVSDSEIEQAYKTNAQKYTIPSKIKVMQYASRNEQALRRSVQNPLIQSPEVQITEQILDTNALNPRLRALLIETENGRFTPIFPVNDRLVALMVREKIGTKQLPLDQVKQLIFDDLKEQSQKRAIANYFSKARAKAEISILRQIE